MTKVRVLPIQSVKGRLRGSWRRSLWKLIERSAPTLRVNSSALNAESSRAGGGTLTTVRCDCHRSAGFSPVVRCSRQFMRSQSQAANLFSSSSVGVSAFSAISFSNFSTAWCAFSTLPDACALPGRCCKRR